MLSRLRSLWQGLFHRTQLEQDLDDELHFHLECRAGELRRQGLSEAEAIRRARVELGATQAHKDGVREARGLRLLDDLAADVRFAVRNWRKQRGLTVAVLLTLTVGIGVSTAVFTLLNAFLFRAYGVPQPASYTRVFVAEVQGFAPPGPAANPAFDHLPGLLGDSTSFAALVASRSVWAPLDGDPQDVRGRLATCNVFVLHGATAPIAGRLLDGHDCTTGARVAVLAESFWRRRFAADPAIVGRTVTFGGRAHLVVGVAPAAFELRGTGASIWLPYTLAGDWPAPQAWQERFEVTGRLRPGASHRQAQSELQVRLSQFDARAPGRRSTVLVTNGSTFQEPGHLAPKLMIVGLMLVGLSLIVLLATTNVVTLLLARARARRQEIAVRLALGAGRGRLIKMLLTESVLLACAAAALSLLAARELAPALLAWLAPKPVALTLELDWRVWCFVAAITGLAAIGSGLTPALETLNVDLVQSLKGRPGRSSGAGAGRAGRRLLMTAQVALSLALLAGAMLLSRSYLAMPGHRDGAYPSRQIVYATLDPRSPAPPDWAAVRTAVASEVAGIPGVQAVAFASRRPPGGRALRVHSEDGRAQRVLANAVSPDFFAATGLRLLAGRNLDPADTSPAGLVPVIVSRQLARRLWPELDPLGRPLSADGQRFQVVGVASDVVLPGESDGFNLYRPLEPDAHLLLVRVVGEAGPLTPAIQAAVFRAAPAFTVNLRSLQDRFEAQAAELVPAAGLTLVLGLVALFLAVVGVHGVAAFHARSQLRDIGVRLALGASRPQVLRALMRPALRSLTLGLGVGLLITIAAAPALALTVQELNAWDPLPYGVAALLLALASLVAMVRPARWALSVDPAVVLRE